jgi:hypothetical protein
MNFLILIEIVLSNRVTVENRVYLSQKPEILQLMKMAMSKVDTDGTITSIDTAVIRASIQNFFKHHNRD